MIAIIIHCDSISARYLGCYGNEWVQTPAIDRLAHEGMVFDHAFSPLDLLEGGARVQAFDAIAGELVAEGIRCGWGGTRLEARSPLEAEEIQSVSGEPSHFASLLRSAAGWLAEPTDQGHLLWIDVGLAPSGSAPDEDLLARYLEEKNPVDLLGEARGIVEESITVDELDALRDTYAARVAQLDRDLGSFFDELRRRELWEETLVVFSADEGWPLGEHEFVGFARSWIHNERDHVPLVIKMPGGSAGGRSPSLVTPADIGPTIEEALGFEPNESLDQRSLVPILLGEPTGAREYIVSGLNDEEYAIRTTPWKLILPVAERSDERPRQLYSKPEDRFEVNDLDPQKSDIADHLELQIWRYLDARRRGTIDSLPPLRKDILSSS
jgi:hypothetical protein